MKQYDTKGSLGYWLTRSSRIANQYFEDYLNEYDCVPNEYAILNCIYNNRGHRPCEIAEYLNLDRGYITRKVAKLEQRGFIKRAVLDEDRRYIELSLTATGKKILPKLIQGSIQTNKKIAEVITQKEMDSLRKILHKLGSADFLE